MYWSQVRILAGPPLTKMNDPRFKIIKNYKTGDKINISNTFESGIVSDASLLPGAAGQFDLYVPQDFGSFIGYSYVIDWEEYQ